MKISPLYRLVYFNVRGAAEPIRYLLALGQVPYEDVRYPIHATAKGFGVDATFTRDAFQYKENMQRLPVLHVLKNNIVLGQGHAILRFLSHEHGFFGSNAMEQAQVDALYECIRDIKSEWYKVKKQDYKTRKEFLSNNGGGLQHKLELLEHALPQNNSGTFCVGSQPSLADISLHHMLATPTSIMSGASESFFDGMLDKGRVEELLQNCPRLRASSLQMSELPQVQHWERHRPDTFS